MCMLCYGIFCSLTFSIRVTCPMPLPSTSTTVVAAQSSTITTSVTTTATSTTQSSSTTATTTTLSTPRPVLFSACPDSNDHWWVPLTLSYCSPITSLMWACCFTNLSLQISWHNPSFQKLIQAYSIARDLDLAMLNGAAVSKLI